MINNIDLIKPLLTFSNKDEFYMLYIFKRKKDQPEGEKDNHQSVRTIRTYSVSNLEYLDKRMPEVIALCEMFKARAYIHIRKQDHKDVGLLMIERLALRLRNGVVNQANLFESVVGELHSKEKRWIVDIDNKFPAEVADTELIINMCDPEGEKIITKLPTKNGFHLITKPFNVEKATKLGLRWEIQKNNPTLLYLPDSLN